MFGGAGIALTKLAPSQAGGRPLSRETGFTIISPKLACFARRYIPWRSLHGPGVFRWVGGSFAKAGN